MSPTPRDEAVETVRARTDIVELVGRYLKLKKVGSRYVGLCPFHTEKTPSFSVSPQKGFFHCFGCKASGDVFTFLMRMDGKSFPEALEELANRAGVELPARRKSDPARRERQQRQLALLERVTTFYQEQLGTPGAADARRYLDERGLPAELIQRYRLGYAPKGWQNVTDRLGSWGANPEEGLATGLLVKGKRGPYDMFRNRVVFPITGLDDKARGFGARKLDPEEHGGKYINSPQGPNFDKSEILYGLAEARQAIQRGGQAVLVEGYFDVLSLVAAGIDEAVATCGTSLTEGHTRLLKRFCDRVVTVFDADQAGRKASIRAAEMLLAEDISPYMLELPAGEDPDSHVRAIGGEAFRALLDDARPSVEVLSDSLLAAAGDDVEGRTRAVQQLMPLLRACRDGVRRGAYLRLVAERFRLDESDLRRSVEGSRQRPRSPAPDRQPAPPSRSGPVATRDELRLVALLIGHPQLAPKAVEAGAVDDVMVPELARLAEQIAAHPDQASPANLIDRIEDPASREWLAAEMVRAAETTADGAGEDLSLLLRKLRFASLHRQKQELDKRIDAASRGGEGEEVRALLAAKLAVDREIQALGLAVKRMP